MLLVDFKEFPGIYTFPMLCEFLSYTNFIFISFKVDIEIDVVIGEFSLLISGHELTSAVQDPSMHLKGVLELHIDTPTHSRRDPTHIPFEHWKGALRPHPL